MTRCGKLDLMIEKDDSSGGDKNLITFLLDFLFLLKCIPLGGLLTHDLFDYISVHEKS